MSKISPKFFKTPLDFRKWLEKNHLKEKELLVGFYKVGSGKKSMSWSESVDQALCFGWIDSVRRSIDEESYSIRFTPRKPNSIWSNINLKKMKELEEKKLIFPAGYEIYNKRKEIFSEPKGTLAYNYENSVMSLSPEYEKIFKKNKKAWEWFQKTAPSYQKTVSRWVMHAKQESTRLKRLNELISDSANERKIKQADYSNKK
jgi:uncharacterized protein YdeI (YjbR/CyaY-like superfamily)